MLLLEIGLKSDCTTFVLLQIGPYCSEGKACVQQRAQLSCCSKLASKHSAQLSFCSKLATFVEKSNGQFQATALSRTVFWRNFRFLTKVANFKPNVSCAECLDPNFKQQDSSARCSGQVLDCSYKKATFKQTVSYAECLHPNFKQHDSCARCFRQVFAF